MSTPNSLFDKDFRYTPDASRISDQFNAAVHDIFARAVANGFSPREVSHLLIGEAHDLECSTVLELNAKSQSK